MGNGLMHGGSLVGFQTLFQSASSSLIETYHQSTCYGPLKTP
jgi:hypothetical protein